MKSATETFCDEWAATLRYWVAETNKVIDQPISEYTWVLNQEAFRRLQPLLQQAASEDVAALFADFGAGLLHSLLVSFEQGPIHVRGPSASVVEAESGVPLGPGLNELFMSAAMDIGLIK